MYLLVALVTILGLVLDAAQAQTCGADATSCLVEATSDDIMPLLKYHEVTCVAFYSREDHEEWFNTLPVIEAVARYYAVNDSVAIATVNIGRNTEVARQVAATGPVSIKLFSKHLQFPKSYSLFARHQHGLFNISVAELTDQIDAFVLNSTGIAELDTLAVEFGDAFISSKTAEAKEILMKARKAVVEYTDPQRRAVANIYIDAMIQMLNRGIQFLAKAMNRADYDSSVEAAVKREMSETKTQLQHISSYLLKQHVYKQFSKAMLAGDDEDTKAPEPLNLQYRRVSQTPEPVKKRSKQQSSLV